jgi:thiopeptide-type bacteriocin biosynthesis protein
MSELSIDRFLLIRSPAYSYENFNPQFLKKVLCTDFFRASIFFASQTLFIELRKKDFDYDQLSPQARTTLWKYLNRMCFRSLPYGLFSSYSSSGWAENQDEGLCLCDDHELVVHPDFKVAFNYINSLNAGDYDALKYYTNNSMYRSAKQFRFISQTYAAQTKFSIVELKIAPGLGKLLKFISKGQNRAAIIAFLKNEYGEDVPADEYFQSLVEGQVIVSELTPNITGISYHQRCAALLDNYTGVDHDLLRSFRQTFSDQQQALPELNVHISSLTDRGTENSTYSLYQRQIKGGARKEMQAELVTLIGQLDKLTADHELDNMSRFKADFIQKYDQQEVPLMMALDPGSGIGYENLAAAFTDQNEDFIEDIRVKEERNRTAGWGQVEKMLFKKWNSLHGPGTGKIMISAEDLKKLPESRHRLPPGLFVLFKSIDDEIWVDTIGGVSGVELSGRFAGNGTHMESCLKAVCEQEIAVNSDFIFAEIAFSPNDRASNVNQRGNFYAYEIPVLTHSVLPDQQVIKLDDLVISVRNDMILLRSVRLNRYIIPRLSSAYNYRLSTIPVFRFLCDLQFQGIKSNMSLSLPDLFPGMDYYPRVQVEKAILSPATWILNEEQLRDIIGDDGQLNEELNLPDYFSLNEGDNFLVFNKHSTDDLEMFQKCLKNKKTATLTEYVFAERAGLKNAAGESFASQMLACVINRSKSYDVPRQQQLKPAENGLKVRRSFLPGEEWLYVKIYAHYSLTNEILINFVLPVVKKYKKDNPGFKWFFIRYKDPNNHLRLRFFTAGRSSYTLLSELTSRLQPWSREGKIADVILDSYQRELEKYSAVLINEIESFFYRDSEFILFAFTTHELTHTFKLSFAVHSTLHLIHCFIRDKKDRLDFLNDVLNNLSAEFSREKEVIRKLDVKYRMFQKELIGYQVKKNNQSFNYYQQLMLELNEKTTDWEGTDKYNLLINLVHMHVNRIFENNPREYEYLVYHFMKKHQSYLNYTATG